MARLIETRTNYSMMEKPTLTVVIELDGGDPVEVIVEKIRASLPKTVRSFRERSPGATPEGRQHPFDGPEMFDDGERSETPSPQGWDTPHGEVPHESISDSYPRLKELFDAKRAEVRGQRYPMDEGEWLLNSDDDNIGKDCE